MKIEVLGTGCPKCKKTSEVIERVMQELKVEAELVHVTNINDIVARGVMMTPGVIIDDEIKSEGRVPDEKTVRGWLA